MDWVAHIYQITVGLNMPSLNVGRNIFRAIYCQYTFIPGRMFLISNVMKGIQFWF